MIGKTLSHFEIREKLGAGGMGEVFLAEDTNLKRKVAVKLLSSELSSDPKARQLIFREARAASQLSHPNIATVYEVDEVEGTPFIAMEFIGGESLKGPGRSPRVLERPTRPASSTATSNRATSWSTSAER
jgi:serine/threonine-protein kinase